MQAKFYARSYGGSLNELKMESDKLIVIASYNYLLDSIQVFDREVYWYHMSIFYVLNTIIAIVGTYSVSAGLHKLTALSKGRFISLTIDQVDDLYWAVVIVCGVVNFVITVMNLYFALIYGFLNLETSTSFKYPALILLCIIEIVSLFVFSKNFKTTDSVCCFSHRHMLRVIHTLAWCQLVWFLHHVGSNLLVAIFFITIAPAQTLAAITLLYLVLVCTILYIAYNINSFRKYRRCCKRKCKLFITSVLYLFTVAFISLLTLIFNDLADNGLTSSGLGSIILSLVAPTIVFIITLKLKRQLGSFFKPPEEVSTDIENPSTNTDSSPHDTNENTHHSACTVTAASSCQEKTSLHKCTQL